MHIGQLKGDSLVVANFGAESLSHFRIFASKVISTCGYSEGLSCNPDTTSGKGFHRKSKSETIFADSVFLGNFHIVENQGMCVASPDSQFIFFWADFKTFPTFFHYKGIDSFVLFLLMGLCDY